MTPHRALNAIAGGLLAMAIGISMVTAHLLDEPDGLQIEIEIAESVQLAQDMAQAAAAAEELDSMLERAADQQCIRMHGPRFRHRWTDGGDLICIQPGTGRRAVIVATNKGP